MGNTPDPKSGFMYRPGIGKTYTGSVFFILLLFLFKSQILLFLGNWLIVEDPLEKCDAMLLCAGSPQDRCLEGAKLFNERYVPVIYCFSELGGRFQLLMPKGIKDCDVTKHYLVHYGADSTSIITIPFGTSTYDEATGMIAIAKKRKYKKVMVVSSKFHTRRIDLFLRGRFEKAGIQMVLRGSSSLDYKEEDWWKHEYGLIFVSNEYIKIVYYLFKYTFGF